MNLSSDKIERLIFIKFLLLQAEKQKNLERPNSSTAILTIHDLVECFLQLAIEHLTNNTKLTGNNILYSYTEELNKVLLSKKLTVINKAYIKRLNEIRNQLKHSTIFIDKKNIENLFFETDIFIKDFTKIFFDIAIEDISILQLIAYEDIKMYLIEAEKNLLEKEFHLSVINCGKAFYEYEQLATDIKDSRGHDMIKTNFSRVDYILKFNSSINQTSLDNNLKQSLRDIAKDINEMKKEISSLRKIQLLSVDTKKYFHFKHICPGILKIRAQISGNPEFYIPQAEALTKDSFNYEQAKFSFDFVVDTIINFQNRGYA